MRPSQHVWVNTSRKNREMENLENSPLTALVWFIVTFTTAIWYLLYTNAQKLFGIYNENEWYLVHLAIALQQRLSKFLRQYRFLTWIFLRRPKIKFDIYYFKEIIQKYFLMFFKLILFWLSLHRTFTEHTCRKTAYNDYDIRSVFILLWDT